MHKKSKLWLPLLGKLTDLRLLEFFPAAILSIGRGKRGFEGRRRPGLRFASLPYTSKIFYSKTTHMSSTAKKKAMLDMCVADREYQVHCPFSLLHKKEESLSPPLSGRGSFTPAPPPFQRPALPDFGAGACCSFSGWRRSPPGPAPPRRANPGR